MSSSLLSEKYGVEMYGVLNDHYSATSAAPDLKINVLTDCTSISLIRTYAYFPQTGNTCTVQKIINGKYTPPQHSAL